jgi:hypothetical protein
VSAARHWHHLPLAQRKYLPPVALMVEYIQPSVGNCQAYDEQAFSNCVTHLLNMYLEA